MFLKYNPYFLISVCQQNTTKYALAAVTSIVLDDKCNLVLRYWFIWDDCIPYNRHDCLAD